jgi:hypothetical protein
VINVRDLPFISADLRIFDEASDQVGRVETVYESATRNFTLQDGWYGFVGNSGGSDFDGSVTL